MRWADVVRRRLGTQRTRLLLVGACLSAAILCYSALPPLYAWKDIVKLAFLPSDELFATCDGCVLLDVGSGSGCWATHLEARFTNLKRVDAADIGTHRHEPFAGVCKPPILYTSPSLSFAPNASYDGVMFVFVLHHAKDVAQQRALLAETARVLKPGGFVLLVEDLPLTEHDRALVALHASLPCFHLVSEWEQLFAEHGLVLRAFDRLPTWYTLGARSHADGPTERYRPAQGWMWFAAAGDDDDE